jgi:D-galacturonate reductase
VNIDQAHRGYNMSTDGDGYRSLNPLFMKYTPTDGKFSGQMGYGYRCVHVFMYLCIYVPFVVLFDCSTRWSICICLFFFLLFLLLFFFAGDYLRSFKEFVDAVALINSGAAEVADFDHRVASIGTTFRTTAILEAGRRSLDGQCSVQILYSDPSKPCQPTGLSAI